MITRRQLSCGLVAEENFKLSTLGGDPIVLEVLGAEIEGRDVYVYQQAALKAPPDGLIVSCNLMRSFIPDQINHVDMKIGGETKSLAFRGTDGPKEVSF